MQLKYSNYAAFSHVHGVAVNNSGLLGIFLISARLIDVKKMLAGKKKVVFK